MNTKCPFRSKTVNPSSWPSEMLPYVTLDDCSKECRLYSKDLCIFERIAAAARN